MELRGLQWKELAVLKEVLLEVLDPARLLEDEQLHVLGLHRPADLAEVALRGRRLGPESRVELEDGGGRRFPKQRYAFGADAPDRVHGQATFLEAPSKVSWSSRRRHSGRSQ